MDEITRLKKVIENRESTITFLNDILDAQSDSIGKLKDKIALLEGNIEELQKENKELNESIEVFAKDEIFNLSKLRMYIDENKALKAKLSVLFNAFESIKEPTEVKDEVSEEKKRHDKELSSKQWKKKREEVFERYGKQCAECGDTKNIQVHHLIYRKGHHLWEYDVSELIPLCKHCHQEVHNDKNHKFHEKYVS